MQKSFVERLTDKQVMAFLERIYPKKERYSCSIIKSPNYIYVHVDQNMGDSVFNFTLEDYNSTIGGNKNGLWLKYLYEIFGEEYKKAFIDEVAEIFD